MTLTLADIERARDKMAEAAVPPPYFLLVSEHHAEAFRKESGLSEKQFWRIARRRPGGLVEIRK